MVLGGTRRSFWLKLPLAAFMLMLAAATVILFLHIIPPVGQGRAEPASVEETGHVRQGEDDPPGLSAAGVDGGGEARGREEVPSGEGETSQPAPGSGAEESPGVETPVAETPPAEAPGTPTGDPDSGAPYYEIELPLPDQGSSPGESGQPATGPFEDIYGAWVLNMTGSQLGLKNCRLDLHADGTITCPPSYGEMIEIRESEFRWEKGKAEFNAVAQVLIKLDALQGLTVPVTIELKGTVSASLAEIRGDFTATPQGGAFATYGETGVFAMRRSS